jgi:hypothetical protein
VVGSALVQLIEKAKGSAAKAREAGLFVARLKRAMKKVSKKNDRRPRSGNRGPRTHGGG